MIIRKLVTLLGFQIDESEANRYETRLHQLRDVGQSIATRGAAMTAGFTAPVLAALGQTLGAAGEVETSMNLIQEATKASADDMARLKSEVEGVATSGASSFAEVSAMALALQRQGMSVEQLVNGGLKAADNLALATGTATDQVADIISDTARIFEVSADQLAGSVNQVTGTLNASKLSANDYGQALSAGGGMAAQAGVSLADFNAVMSATAGYLGVGADQGTSLKTALLAILNPSKGAAEAMAAYGLELTDANGNVKDMASLAGELQTKLAHLSDGQRVGVLGEVFGSDAARMGVVLADIGRAGIEAQKGLIAQGDAAAMAGARLKGYQGALAAVGNAIEAVGAAIASSGLLQWATDGANALAGFIGELAKANPLLIRFGTVFALIGAAIGPVLIALGATIALLGGPVTLAFIAFSALAAYLIAFWPEIQAQWAGIVDWLSTFFDSPIEHLKQVFAWIGENWAALILGLPGVILAVFTPSVFRPIQDAFEGVVNWIGDQWDALWARITGGVSAIGNRISGFFGRAAADDPRDSGTTTGPDLIPVAPRAKGGPVEPGRSYLVGEEGPELVSPRSRGLVLPAGLTAFMRSFENMSLPTTPIQSGGGRTTVIHSSPQINVQADIRVPEGTTAEQGRLFTEQIGRVFDDKIRDVIRTTGYSFVEMEAPV